jgi:hypothetical protein
VPGGYAFECIRGRKTHVVADVAVRCLTMGQGSCMKLLSYKGSEPEPEDLYPAARHRSLILLRAEIGLRRAVPPPSRDYPTRQTLPVTALDRRRGDGLTLRRG